MRKIRRRWVVDVLALAAGAVLSTPARATNWINGAGGVFHFGTNWDTGVVPGSTDTAIFDLNDFPGYTVSLIANVTNSSLHVRDDSVTLSLPASVTYFVSNTALIGNLSGDSGFLSFSNGKLDAANTTLGASGGSAGTLSLAGGLWDTNAATTVGSFGTGTINFTGTASLTTGTMTLGLANTGVGTVNLNSASASATVGSALNIGSAGEGTLNVHVGSDFTTQSATIGVTTAGVGTLSVANPGSVFTSAGSMLVGSQGRGTAIVESSGLLTSNTVTLGQQAGSNGTVTVDGNSSAWNSAALTIGSSGVGSVTVINGADTTHSSVVIGNAVGGSGQLLVTGINSRLDSSGLLVVGNGGVGSVTVQNGGFVEAQNINVAEDASSRGTVSLLGTGSALHATTNMYVGGSGVGAGGIGSLTIPVSTSVTVGGLFKIWPNGTVNLNGGTLTTGNFDVPGGTFNFNSGTLNLTTGNFIIGATGQMGSVLQLDADQHISTATATVSTGALLVLNGGTFATTGGAVGMINNGEIQLIGPTAQFSGRMTNRGLLTGSGRIATTGFTNDSTGEVRVSGTERILFTGPVTNVARMNFLNGATLEFAGGLTNGAGGRINGRGILVAAAPVINSGEMTFSGGFTDFMGNLVNNAGAHITVTGTGVTTFYNPITHNSDAEIEVGPQSTAVFMADVDGGGDFSGPGLKIFEAATPALGPIVTTGSTIVKPAASLSATHIREDNLTVSGSVSINTSGGASHLNELSIVGEGVLDLKNNSLVLESGDLAAITAQIRAGLNEGKGILSTAPGAPFRLGSMSNAGTFYSTFQGISGLNGDEVLIRYTRIGDLNLDGTVTIADFIDLAAHFNTIGGAIWQVGDVNYDGSVTISDFIDLASNFNQSVSGASIPISEDDRSMLDTFAAAHVPEPGLVGLLSISTLWMSRRSRQRLR